MIDELEAPGVCSNNFLDDNDEQRYWQYVNATKHKTQIENYKKPIGSGDGESNLSSEQLRVHSEELKI